MESMGQAGTFHSVGSGWANASNTPWRLYKHFNHEGGIASPAIFHWPDGIDRPADGMHRHPAHIIDLVPTLMAAAQVPTDTTLPGVDLVPELHGRTTRRQLFFEHQGNRAVRDGRWKLVALDDEPWELYDLTNDRIESRDLAQQYPERGGATREGLDAWPPRIRSPRCRVTWECVTSSPIELRCRYSLLRANVASGSILSW